MKVNLLIFLTLLIGLPKLAAREVTYTYEGTELKYNILSDDPKSKTCETARIYSISGDVIIPSAIVDENGVEFSVIKIGDDSFNLTRLTSVEIPNTVTSIGKNAFENCTRLGHISIPNSVVIIEENAFNLCSRVEEIIIPNSVVSIGNKAFSNCTNLTRLTIGESVEYIWSWAFYNCTSLAQIAIPNSVRTIGEYAFGRCSNLTDVSLGNSVSSIDRNAFSNCEGLSKITIPNSVTTIGQYAFMSCSNLKTIYFNAEHCTLTKPDEGHWLNSTAVEEVIFGDKVRYIPEYAFRHHNLSEINLPNSVTEIGKFAFFDCNAEQITIPNSVTSIGEDAFSGNLIRSLTIPNSLTSIDVGVFSACLLLEEVTIPNSVTSIGNSAFSQCYRLKQVTIPNSVTSIGNGAFRQCYDLGQISIGNSVTSIGNGAFETTTNLKKVIISDLRAWARIKFGNAESNPIYYSHSFQIYEAAAPIENLVLDLPGDSVEDYAFCNAQNLKTIRVNASSIGSYSFYGCNNLTDLCLNTKGISKAAFYDAPNLKNIYVLTTSAPTAPDDVFSNYTGVKLFVPKGSIPNYEYSETCWYKFLAIIESDFKDLDSIFAPRREIVTVDGINYEITPGGDDGKDMVNVIGGESDDDGTLSIPSTIEIEGKMYSVTEIGNGAFRDGQDIRKVVVSPLIGTIGKEAFSGCTNLEEVIIEDSENTLKFGENAFKCAPIKTIYLGRKTEVVSENQSYSTIGHPFAYNDSLSDLTIGEKVTEIDSFDFTGCGNIKNITVLNPTPPTFPGHLSPFDDNVYKTAILRVPQQNPVWYQPYKTAYIWSDFVNIIYITDIIPVEIKLESSNIELAEGATTTLKVIFTPENTTITTLTWSSSNTEVATVDATGLVKAVKVGTGTITATTANGLAATSTITVIAAPSSAIDGIKSDDKNVRVEGTSIIAPEGCLVFDFNGRRVATTGLRPGIYIVRTPAGKTVKISIM